MKKTYHIWRVLTKDLWLLPQIAFGCLITSCELTADIDDYTIPTDNSYPIVSCLAVGGSAIEVYVGLSTSYLDNNSTGAVDYAIIELVGDSTSYSAIISDTETQKIRFEEARPKPGDMFQIYVQTMQRVLFASITMPDVVPIRRVATYTNDQELLRFTLTMNDALVSDDFYQVELRRRSYREGRSRDSVLTAIYDDIMFQNAPSIIGVPNEPNGYFSDAKTTESTYRLRFSTPWSTIRSSIRQQDDSTTIVVRLYHHSSDYYYFMQTSNQSQQYALLPVFGSNTIHSNITGGGYGIAAGTVFDEKEIRIEQDPETGELTIR